MRDRWSGPLAAAIRLARRLLTARPTHPEPTRRGPTGIVPGAGTGAGASARTSTGAATNSHRPRPGNTPRTDTESRRGRVSGPSGATGRTSERSGGITDRSESDGRDAARSVPTAQLARHVDYQPQLDGAADPGEVVWTLVAYEEDPTRAKDRPVLVVGRDGRSLLGLMLSSNGERDGQRDWLGIGSGPWDGAGRPSWVRLDRVLVVPEHGIRREGAVLDRERFDTVAAALRRDHGWR
ncbi:hypothetical protein GCM10010123_26990 [Pilimelia anulata]|uniref:Type II toxin-antitoxin system PemK/MazF family toxin n=1 Tax=Pilimelia anulata TaxID=53371 RepID=A0A8J3B8G4_9ACTN|nr:type II toxin-antitoxin system PemK/MazF family toxin [Pilimelia anulata]GGJ95707.1 hypothetical protein GCM10010123_26990 [Pilimelia anulata]